MVKWVFAEAGAASPGKSRVSSATTGDLALAKSSTGKELELDSDRRSQVSCDAASICACVCAFTNRSKILVLALKKFWSSGTGGGMNLSQSSTAPLASSSRLQFSHARLPRQSSSV